MPRSLCLALTLLALPIVLRAAEPVLQPGDRVAIVGDSITEQKLYTISDGTRKILGEIDEPINLYFFYSDKTAKDLVVLRNYARCVEEMLKAYERAAGGKIKLHIVDPEPFSEAEDKAAEFGLQAVPLQQGGDQVYFGLAGTNSVDDTQIIPFFPLDQEEFLEYEISRVPRNRLAGTLPQPYGAGHPPGNVSPPARASPPRARRWTDRSWRPRGQSPRAPPCAAARPASSSGPAPGRDARPLAD